MGKNSPVVTTVSKVETLDHNPFDFVLESYASQIPFEYVKEEAVRLTPYLERASSGDDVSRFAQAIALEVNHETVPFLSALTRRIHENWQYQVRPLGDPWPASTTFQKRRGACRDLAVLLIDCFREAGLAARFVSGYRKNDARTTELELHAWAEVYLPGAGWRGYDPTTGLAVADGHVALAAGPNPRVAAPTSGTFRGTGVDSSIRTSIDIRIGER